MWANKVQQRKLLREGPIKLDPARLLKALEQARAATEAMLPSIEG